MAKKTPVVRIKRGIKGADGRINNRFAAEVSKATQFKKGQSGNPAGTTKNPFPKLIREATNNGQEIIDGVLDIFRFSQSEKTRMWAAEFLRDTGWHKPVIGIRGTDDEGNDSPLRVIFER